MIQEILLALPVLLIASLSLYHWVAPHVLSYRLTESRIEIRAFGFLCVRWIPFASIGEIREVRWRDAVGILGTIGMVFGEKWSNRAFIKSWVLIRPKGARLHHITITPKNPTAFVEQVKAHLTSS